MNFMKKNLAIILTLAMIFSTLVPMSVFAASKNTVVGAVPNIAGTGNYTLATLRIDEDVLGNFAAGDVIVLTLPSGVDFSALPAATVIRGTGAAGVALTATPALTGAANVVNVTIGGGPDDVPSVITLTMPVTVTSVGTGAINVNVSAPGTAIAQGDYTIGNFVSGAGTISALSAPKAGGSTTFGSIRLIENAIGSLTAGETITLKLPSGYTWGPGAPALTDTTDLVVGAAVGTGTRDLTFTVGSAGTTGQSIIDITTPVVVGSTAKKGDITVALGGTGEFSGDVVIGSYVDYDVTVTGADSKAVTAAKDDQRIAKVTIKEGIAGSLLPGRTITATLPEGARFAAATSPTLTLESGNNIWATFTGTLSDSDRKVSFTMAGTASTVAAELTLKNVDIDVAANFSGDVEMVVAGTAGASATLLVAEAAPIVTLSAEAKEVKIGTQAQAIGDITITEGAKEALLPTNSVTINAPTGVSFANLPTVEVVEGDVEIGTVTKTAGTITIPVDSDSTKASSIKVSNIQVTVDRTVAEGDIEFSVAGTAVMQNTPAFTNVSNAGSAVAAKVVTPAPGEVTKIETTFTIGSSSYTVGDATVTADVAPFIQDSRTMVPVRFVSQALGVSESNVIWDGNARTVTIIGDKVIQLTIGSKTMLVNGATVTMDTEAIISDSRSFVPISWLAMALGVEYSWNAETKSVTFK